MKIKRRSSEIAFDIFNFAFLCTFALMIIIPFLNVFAVSLSSNNAIINGRVTVLPVSPHADNYEYVMKNPVFWNSFRITAAVVSAGTLICLTVTVLTAYPLSKMNLVGRKPITLLLIFTMVFQAPLIPTFLNLRMLGLYNTLWALILPGALSVYNTLICTTFFRGLPEDLYEAARMDGLGEYGILVRIVLPLSPPIISTLMLFFAVGFWNNYSSALYFISNTNLRPLSLYLWSLVAQTDMAEVSTSLTEAAGRPSPEGLKMATVLVATIPILIVYPFLQKHFVKGALIGSVKG